MAHYDALLIIHQDTPADYIHSYYSRDRWKKVYILTTHHLFTHERDALKDLLPASELYFSEFSSLLNDHDMQACDDAASEELLNKYDDKRIHRQYSRTFMSRSIYHKNALIFRLLSQAHEYDRIYYNAGLGVSDVFWNNQGAVSLRMKQKRSFSIPDFYRISRKLLSAWKRRCSTPITLIPSEDKYFVFFDSTRRLLIKEQTPRRYYPYFGARLFLLYTKLRRWKPVVIATSIHNFAHQLTTLGHPVEIFIDGYHPSNYPRSYIDQYTNGTFIVRDMFDAAWFGKFEKAWRHPYAFTKTMAMTEDADAPSTISTIYLILNHAGDWTALINRSDTDILVEAFCHLATAIPELNFVIRLHPTMDLPEHEGAHSSTRLREYVQRCELMNLHVSESTLEQDLADGDLFLSEYSNVILDIFREGKLGLIVNLTGRRSFMQDYETLGFPMVNSEDLLLETVHDIINNPADSQLRQNQSARIYNRNLNTFLKTP